MSDESILGGETDFSHRLNQALATSGVRPNHVAKALGVSRQAVGHWQKARATPSAEFIRRIAQLTGESFEWLATGRRGAADLAENVPLFGTAAGSLAGAIHLGAEPIDWLVRPPALSGDSRAYAVIVTGSSMVPEHNPGDLRFVSPGRQPSPGDSVIVQTAGRGGQVEAWIKRLVRRTQTTLYVSQHEPPAMIEFPLSRVRRLDKVLGTADLFGLGRRERVGLPPQKGPPMTDG